jgi:dolichol-phosphate mannosyltransferase
VHGESKLDILVGLEYLQLLLDKALRGWLPVTYLIFSLVGTCGLVANVILVYALLHLSDMSFDAAQLTAGMFVIALNFLMNNCLTFRSARLRGTRMIPGFVLFYLACSIGLSFNLAAAHGFRDLGLPWYMASLIGIAIGSVWNCWMASLLIWGIGRRRIASSRAAYGSTRAAETRKVATN